MNLRTLDSTDSWAWPDEAGEYLMGLLRDPSTAPDDALLAVELAGDFVVASDAMAETLMAVLMDRRRTESLRQGAAMSLGPMLEAAADNDPYDPEDDPGLSPAALESLQGRLRTLYEAGDTPEQLRRRVLEASVRDPREWHAAAIRGAYDNPAEASQVSAMFCMGYVRGFDEEILSGLRHDNEDLRYHAVVAAGNAALGAAWDPVVAMLKNERTDKSLRLAAIDAAAAIRPEEAYEVLHSLVHHRDEDIASAAHEALSFAAAIELDAEDEYDADDDNPFNDDDLGDTPEDDAPAPRNGHHRH